MLHLSVGCSPRWPAQRRRGLTLIELVVVLVILAALAMMVLPRLDFLKNQADYAQAAATAADVMSNLGAYKATTGYYPLRLDSLTDGTDVYAKLYAHSPATPSSYFTLTTLSPGAAGSFAHAFGSDPSGNTTVTDHDNAATDPSNSGTITRTIDYSAVKLVALKNTAAAVPGVPDDPGTPGDETVPGVAAFTSNKAVIQAAGFPSGTIDSGVTLVVMGVGPSSSLIGKTMANAPRYSGSSATEYARFLAVFAVFDSGKPAELRTVVDPRRTTIESRIGSYKGGAPTHQ